MLDLSCDLAKRDKKNIDPIMFHIHHAFLAQSEAHPLLQLSASWCAVWNYTHRVCADGGSVLKLPECEASVSYDRPR